MADKELPAHLTGGNFLFTDTKPELVFTPEDLGGDEREMAFLREVHDGGCREFMTVLGPNYDGNHHDHFHLDLARHGPDGLKRICK